MSLFNNFIEKYELKEIYRKGERFTWTNNQDPPTLSNIDRILASIEWEEKFPLTTLTSLTRVGSDHSPLLLDTGELQKQHTRQFFFERQWCSEVNFAQLVEDKWTECKKRWLEQAYSVDKWHRGLSNLRSFLKGWGDNLRWEY